MLKHLRKRRGLRAPPKSTGGGGGSDSDDDDDGKMGPYADSGEGGMGLEADAGTILKTTMRRRNRNKGLRRRERIFNGGN